MSMRGVYIRLTPDEYARAAGDPGWAEEFADGLRAAEPDVERPPPTARVHRTDRAWHGLDFLLRRRGFPVDVIHGEEPIPGAGDRGSGPPGLLSPERVRAAADAFAVLGPAELSAGVTPADLAAAEIHPASWWADPYAVELLTGHYVPLAAFFRATALRGHALVMWID
ncbi:YfbM family protein [Streptomyces sp. NPDC006798]|uniref:YfbM family protein n=1 Tax=Streptomyces sp. NPDC006798 TaxID=3155462 RepID=UPI0034116C1E